MNCVGLEKLHKRICKPARQERKKGPGHESITAHWSSRAEAHSFWRLVKTGKLSFHKAKQDILMSERQLRWLRAGWPLESGVMEAIYELRVATWKAFLYLCTHPEFASGFQRAALMQSGKVA